MEASRPRRPGPDLAPALLAGAAGLGLLIVGWRIGVPEPATAITVSRAFDHAPSLRRLEEPTSDAATVIEGQMRGSLYQSVERAGATSKITAEVVDLLSHKLDLSRDLHPGDLFRLVVDDQDPDQGEAVEAQNLLYAEIDAEGRTTRVYRYRPLDAAAPEFVDDNGRSLEGLLLRTPIDGARITSTFGMRLHPLLGYSRMHQGLDFGAPVGTPVYAAGDGIVEEAAWKGGYGRWLKLGHAGGWETGYGHLSGWAVRPGQAVRQGQVIAYTGSTGESTGPHLHYEVIRDGVKINPESDQVPSGAVLDRADMTIFRAERAWLDSLVAPDGQAEAQLVRADAPRPAVIGLRTSENP